MTSAPAGASATGCASYIGSYSSYLCNHTDGSGLAVYWVQIYRYDQQRTANYCGYQAKVTYELEYHTSYSTWYSPYHSGCTYPPKAWFDWYPGTFMQNGSKICGYWREDYSSTFPNIAACIGIHS
jgi:hypothetical protein